MPGSLFYFCAAPALVTRLGSANAVQAGPEKILAAISEFDKNFRNSHSFRNWQTSYTYFISYNDKLYPAKKIAQLATNNEKFNSTRSQAYLRNNGFEMISLLDPERPALDGPAFVVIDKYGGTQQENDSLYIFDLRASGDSRKLAEAVRAQQMGGKPVYFIVYQLGPAYSFVSWAKVAKVTGDDQTSYRLELERHLFPEPLDLKRNGANLLTEIAWLHNGLKPAFNYRLIRKITDAEFNTIIAAASQEELSLEDAAFAVISEDGRVLALADIYRFIKDKSYYEANFSESELNRKLTSDARFNDLGENKWCGQPFPPVITRLPALELLSSAYFGLFDYFGS